MSPYQHSLWLDEIPKFWLINIFSTRVLHSCVRSWKFLLSCTASEKYIPSNLRKSSLILVGYSFINFELNYWPCSNLEFTITSCCRGSISKFRKALRLFLTADHEKWRGKDELSDLCNAVAVGWCERLPSQGCSLGFWLSWHGFACCSW